MPPLSSTAKGPLSHRLTRYSSLLRSLVSHPSRPPPSSPPHSRSAPPLSTPFRTAQPRRPTRLATPATAAFLMAAAAYSTTVTKAAPGSLGALPDDAAAKAHHVKGRNGQTSHFKNPHPSAGETLSTLDIAKLGFKAKMAGEMDMPSTQGREPPSVKPTFLPTRSSSSTTDTATTTTPGPLRATWLGHACYYVEFPSGLRVLFDPVFEPCCSPPPASWLGFPKRFTLPPAVIGDLPFIDAVVISHSHYDHLSLPSVKTIVAKHPNAHFFVGLGLEKWFHSTGIKNVTEMDWWEDAEIKLSLPKPASPTKENGATDSKPSGPSEIAATVSCLPCQHTSGRTGMDKDTTLWCSWGVSSGGKSVFFGGDTGYRVVPRLDPAEDDYGPAHAGLPRNPDFAKIGALRGPFDLGMLPIGAYKPRWVFSSVHASPSDAVEIFKDTRCRHALAMHWGTWVLTSEPVDEPPKLLREALKKSGIKEEGVFDACALGESREF